MDKRLLDILCCPVSKRPLVKLDARRLKQLNKQIEAHQVQYVDGASVSDPVSEALISDDNKVIYTIDDGIPVMLPERGIGTNQIHPFENN